MVGGNSSYTRCVLNDYYWNAAMERVNRAPVYENSHRKEQANEVGFLGEVVAGSWFKQNDILFEDHRASTELDYKINNLYNLDVKTKDRTVVPQIHYDNSVPLYNHDHQRPDYYLFISLLRDRQIDENNIKRFTHAFIVGAIEINQLEKLGKKWEKGETDPDNGTTFWTACINVKMRQLIPLKKVIEIWRSA